MQPNFNMPRIGHVIQIVTEEIKSQKSGWKAFIPYAVAGTIFWGLNDLVLSQPHEKVIWAVSGCLQAGVIGCICKSAFNLIKHLEGENISDRKIEYIKIPKQEFEAIQSEILFLRQQIKTNLIKS